MGNRVFARRRRDAFNELLPASQPPVFMRAEWRNLVMLNYEVDPAIVGRFLPRGVELDYFAGRALVSVVGFQFTQARLWGLAIPYHRDFVEVNLRFYVKRRVEDGWRRGVVFIREIAPRRAVSLVARLIYNEQYVTMPMTHRVQLPANAAGVRHVSYSWRSPRRWNHVRAAASGELAAATPGSEAEFIAEHYYAYTAQHDGGTLEYQVDHRPWRTWQLADYEFDCDVARIYGPEFVAPLSSQPSSALLLDGSPVAVRRGVKIDD